MKAAQPDITISIASYNTRELLRPCLKSLQHCAQSDGVSVEVIVADNGSTDGSVAMVAQEFPDVLALDFQKNLGYGKANNEAFARSEGRLFLILNSDTEVQPGTLRKFIDFFQAYPDGGAAGAQLILPDGSLQGSWAREPGLLWVFCEQFFIDRVPILRNYIFGAPYTGDPNAIRAVDQVCGAAFIVRREVYSQVGGFDPIFFMYYEDTDLCIRIRAAGHKIYYLPQTRILHHLGASSKTPEVRARMVASYNHSRYYYFTRHKGKFAGALLKFFVVSGATLRLLGWSFVALLKPQKRSQVRLFSEVFKRTWRMKPVLEEHS